VGGGFKIPEHEVTAAALNLKMEARKMTGFLIAVFINDLKLNLIQPWLNFFFK